MFSYVKSMKAIEENFGIPIREQIKQMRRIGKFGLYPSEYFFEGLYLGDPDKFEDYVGIREANRLWYKYSAYRTYIGDMSLKEILSSRAEMKNWINKSGVPTPIAMNANFFINRQLPFVTKEDNSFGGKGVRIYDESTTYFGDQAAYAEQYLPSLPASDWYYFGTVRTLIIARKNNSHIISTIQKYRHKSNPVDNRNYVYNGLAPIRDGIVQANALIVDDISIPHVREKLLRGIGADVYRKIDEIALQLANTVPDGNGVLLGIDTLVDSNRNPYVLEVNNRPGFGIMQVAHREGGLAWLR